MSFKKIGEEYYEVAPIDKIKAVAQIDSMIEELQHRIDGLNTKKAELNSL